MIIEANSSGMFHATHNVKDILFIYDHFVAVLCDWISENYKKLEGMEAMVDDMFLLDGYTWRRLLRICLENS